MPSHGTLVRSRRSVGLLAVDGIGEAPEPRDTSAGDTSMDQPPGKQPESQGEVRAAEGDTKQTKDKGDSASDEKSGRRQ